MTVRTMTLCVIAFLASVPRAVGADSFSMEAVAPRETVAVMEIRDVGDVIARLQGAGLVEEDDTQDINDGIRDFVGKLPSSMSEVWIDVFKSAKPLDVVGSMSGSVALWIDRSEGERGELVLAGWVNLGDGSEAVAEAWDDAWGLIRERPDAMTEVMSGRDVDVFGERSEDQRSIPLKQALWHVREDSRILLSNTQNGLQRMLDVLDGSGEEESLVDEEAWEPVVSMLEGTSNVRAVLLVDAAFAAGDLIDQMGMSAMLRASFDAMVGPVRSIAVSVGIGEQDEIISASGAIWMPSGQGGLLRLLSTESPRASLPAWIGPDTISVSRYNVDFKRIPDWIRTVVASNPMLMGVGQLLDQFEPSVRAILNPLGTKAMMVGTLQHPLTMESLKEVMAITCTDPTGLKDALAATSPKAGFEAREFQGHQIWTIDANKVGMLPLPMPVDERISFVIAGNSMFVGNDLGVEAVLRSLSSRAATPPPWLERAINVLPSEPCACWSTWDVGEQLTAVSDVMRLQVNVWEDELRADDPELWEEIKGELVDEEGASRRERIARIASRLGPAVWWAEADDTGFRLRGSMLAADAEGEE